MREKFTLLLLIMEKLEMHGPKELLQKRKKVFQTLNLEEVDALKASENAEQVAEDFDRIFLKLLRLIKYSTDKNNREKSKIESETNNLIKKFTNYLKKRPLDNKITYEQKAFFDDICSFINFFVHDSYLSTVHNSIPNTSFREYNEKSLWNQLFQNMYARNRWIEWISEWWSCSYWTLLLYNFFNKLNEAWLDLKIKFFRYKNLDDIIVKTAPSHRHSWLIINFQWEDYMVDHDGLIYDKEKTIARPITPYIQMWEKHNDEECKQFFESFRYDTAKETNTTIFFDNVDDFITHCEIYPEYHRVTFYVKFPDKEKWGTAEKVNYEFWNHSFLIWINGENYEYYLKDNDISLNNLTKNMVKKAFIKRNWSSFTPVTDQDREFLKKYLSLVKWKIDLNKVYENLKTWGSRNSELVDFGWMCRVAIMWK